MKNQFKVINLGLNEFGVQEFNNHFKTNIEKSYVSKARVGAKIITNSKTFKQEKSFLNLKEKNYMGSFHFISCDTQKYFELRLEHINYKIVKLVMTENEFEFGS